LDVTAPTITLFPVNFAEALKTRKVQIVIAAVAIILVAALTAWWLLSPKDRQDAASTPAATPSVSSEAAPSPAESASPSGDGSCSPLTPAGFIPVRYSIEKIDVEADVISGTTDSEGFIEAPPLDQPKTAAWWSQGPAAASDSGQVVLSIHTYRNGGAVGNQLYTDDGPQLSQGDVLKLYSAEGQVACYQFDSTEKVMESDYDPESDVMVRYEGDPALAIIICWDFKPETEIWASRIFFKFKPVTA
jgi:conserved hypothetical protein